MKNAPRTQSQALSPPFGGVSEVCGTVAWCGEDGEVDTSFSELFPAVAVAVAVVVDVDDIIDFLLIFQLNVM
jgi:hypothetical protein